MSLLSATGLAATYMWGSKPRSEIDSFGETLAAYICFGLPGAKTPELLHRS